MAVTHNYRRSLGELDDFSGSVFLGPNHHLNLWIHQARRRIGPVEPYQTPLELTLIEVNEPTDRKRADFYYCINYDDGRCFAHTSCEVAMGVPIALGTYVDLDTSRLTQFRDQIATILEVKDLPSELRGHRTIARLLDKRFS